MAAAAAAANFPHLDLFRYATDFEHNNAKILVEAADVIGKHRADDGGGALAYLKEVGGVECYGLSLLEFAPHSAVVPAADAAVPAADGDGFVMPPSTPLKPKSQRVRQQGKKEAAPGSAFAAATPTPAAAEPPQDDSAELTPKPAAGSAVDASRHLKHTPADAAASPTQTAAPAAKSPPALAAAASPPTAVAADPAPAAGTVKALAQRFDVLHFTDAVAQKDVSISLGDDGRSLAFGVSGRTFTVAKPIGIVDQRHVVLSNGVQFTPPDAARRDVVDGLERMATAAGILVEYSQEEKPQQRAADAVTPAPPVAPAPPPSRGNGQARRPSSRATPTNEQHLRQQKDYIKKHKLHVLLGDALDSCLRDLPPDPFFYLASTLMRYKEGAHVGGAVHVDNGHAGTVTPCGEVVPTDRAPTPASHAGGTATVAWGTPPQPALSEYRVLQMENELRHMRELMTRAQAEHELEKEVMKLRSQVAQLVRTTHPSASRASGLPGTAQPRASLDRGVVGETMWGA